MSWQGDYPNAVAHALLTFLKSEQTANDHVRLASAFHSYAVRQHLMWAWHPKKRRQLNDLAAQALAIIDHVWEGPDPDFGAKKYDSCDVSLAVFIRWGKMAGGRENLIEKIIRGVFDDAFDEDVLMEAHTRAFIIGHAMRIGYCPVDEGSLLRLEQLADKAGRDGQKDQAGRVWRDIAIFARQIGDRELVLRGWRKASEAARPDQRFKLRLLRVYGLFSWLR